MGFFVCGTGGGPDALALFLSVVLGTPQAEKVPPPLAVAATVLLLSRPSSSAAAYKLDALRINFLAVKMADISSSKLRKRRYVCRRGTPC